MLSYQSVVIDFEGFRISNQPFVIKELSVRAFDFHDTILLKPPYTSSVLPCKTQKVYAWLTKNLHGLTWESGVHEYSFLFCYFVCLKIRFPNLIVYAKGFEKCSYLRCFFLHVIDLETLNCPSANQLIHFASLNCHNHYNNYLRIHCARKKANLFYYWLSREISSVFIVPLQMLKDYLQLTLSPNLKLTVTPLSHDKDKCSLELVKEEYKKVGEHKLLRKAVITLTPTEYHNLKSSISSYDCFLDFIKSHNVKTTIAAVDERTQHSRPELAEKT